MPTTFDQFFGRNCRSRAHIAVVGWCLPTRTHLTLRELAVAAGLAAGRRVTWRHGTPKTGTNPAMRSSFLAIRVRPANRRIPRGAEESVPEVWAGYMCVASVG
jgi:hypothetical protein